MKNRGVVIGLVFVAVAVAFSAVLIRQSRRAGGSSDAVTALGPLADGIIRDRQMAPADVEAALRTYPRPGKYDDEFVAFLSGGHSGSVICVGIPSMRILKEIPVYGQDSWQGWLTGSKESLDIMEEGYFFKD